jgi:hypothetical protein
VVPKFIILHITKKRKPPYNLHTRSRSSLKKQGQRAKRRGGVFLEGNSCARLAYPSSDWILIKKPPWVEGVGNHRDQDRTSPAGIEDENLIS